MDKVSNLNITNTSKALYCILFYEEIIKTQHVLVLNHYLQCPQALKVFITLVNGLERINSCCSAVFHMQIL